MMNVISPRPPYEARWRFPPLRTALVQAGCVGLALLACSHGPGLEPAGSARTTWQGAAYTTSQGVKVVAEGDIWAGDAEVREYVTPVQLRFENHGVHPLRLRYSAMSLVSPDGQVFRAIPPFEMRGAVEQTVDRLAPRFEYRDIELAPYLGPLYEGIEVEPLDAEIDGEYSDELYSYWEVEVPLPTPYMREIALPESLVRRGGSVSGFVYFERVPESQPRVTLKIRLVDGETGRSFGTARLPFVVD